MYIPKVVGAKLRNFLVATLFGRPRALTVVVSYRRPYMSPF